MAPRIRNNQQKSYTRTHRALPPNSLYANKKSLFGDQTIGSWQANTSAMDSGRREGSFDFSIEALDRLYPSIVTLRTLVFVAG